MAGLINITVAMEEQEGTRAVLGQWLKAPGEAVEIHEPVAELETDKVMVEIPAPASGTLREILKNEGEEVAPGDLLGTIDTDVVDQSAVVATDSNQEKPDQASGQVVRDEQRLSPAIRKLVAQHDLDPSVIPTTGRNGRLTYKDVEAYLASVGSTEPGRVTAPLLLSSNRRPLDPMRQRIAAHMVESMSSAPHVTSIFEADLTAVLADRARARKQFVEQGIYPTLTAYFVAASVAALQEVPEVNSRLHDDEIELFNHCNIGIGTSLGEGGLIVPVIHEAEKLDLFGIAARLDDLTGRAQHGKLTPADVRSGTFSISNHGVSGSLIAAPIIINQPQSAILGLGKLQKRPVVIQENNEDVIRIRPMLYVTLSIDHRVLDGYHTNAFLTKFVDVLETWQVKYKGDT